VLTSESAADLTSASVTCPAKWFQLFHPIGGAAATFVWPGKGREETATAKDSIAKTRIKPCIRKHSSKN
jgi:hypothetical protein